ncbi:hypothetical protein AB0A73_08395 [Glycomyces sp. NPDC047369]
MRPSARPKAVLAAQGVLWLQFLAIMLLYATGLRFLFDATRSSSSHDSMLDVIGSIGAENLVTITLSVAITVSMPFIAAGIGRRRAKVVTTAWWALVIVPAAMYLWILGRAYFATFPDSAPFFMSAAAMLVVCGSFPAVVVSLLHTRAAKAWFAAGELFDDLDRELSDTSEFEAAQTRQA